VGMSGLKIKPCSWTTMGLRVGGSRRALVRLALVRSASVRSGLGTYGWIQPPPFVPGFHSFFQYLQMLRVRHSFSLRMPRATQENQPCITSARVFLGQIGWQIAGKSDRQNHHAARSTSKHSSLQAIDRVFQCHTRRKMVPAPLGAATRPGGVALASLCFGTLGNKKSRRTMDATEVP